MENAPVMTLAGTSSAAGVYSEIWERFKKWNEEVYMPLHMTIPGRTGIDLYQMVKQSPEYPSELIVWHTKDIKAAEESFTNPERIAVAGEFTSWVKRRVIETIWNARYALIKSFRSELSNAQGKEDTRIENAPILHIEGYRFRPDDQDKYSTWLNEYGFSSFIPLFMRLPGIKGYDCYKKVSYKSLVEAREWEYPDFVSALYFQDMTAFENYEKSPELVAYQKALRNVFPNGLNLRWYVEYQLVRSFRK